MISRRILFLLAILPAVVLAASCAAMSNYSDPARLLFAGDHAPASPQFDGVISVVSWNIKFSENIDDAMKELAGNRELVEADILLLQEMDEQGVATIAKTLDYNYIYFPASIHTHHGRNFGNAILSKWPIMSPAKLLLPHLNPRNAQMRIAARAVVLVDEYEVLTYSVHTSTYWLSAAKRNEQVKALLEDVGEQYAHVVVGGDFNTLSPLDGADLVETFEQAGFVWATEEAGSTMSAGRGLPLGLTLDFIFAKGTTVLAAGRPDSTNASDHLPIWATLMPQ